MASIYPVLTVLTMHRCIRSFPFITLLHLCLADQLRIDDFNLGIEYSGGWSDGNGIPDDASQNWNGTLHYSNLAGATATLNFTGKSHNLLRRVTAHTD